MKPISYHIKIDVCEHCGGCMGQTGIPQFTCEMDADFSLYTDPCTKEDYQTCPLNPQAVKE